MLFSTVRMCTLGCNVQSMNIYDKEMSSIVNIMLLIDKSKWLSTNITNSPFLLLLVNNDYNLQANTNITRSDFDSTQHFHLKFGSAVKN